MSASVHASRGCSFIMIDAPMKGMKSGAVTGMPSHFAAMTWPISWTKIRTTMPAAYFQPKKRAT